MSKYEPLKRHLSRLSEPEWRAGFGDVERVLGFPLPPSSRKHRALWSNNPRGHVMTQAWLEAGWRAEQVDLKGERLVFRRAAGSLKGVGKPSAQGRPLFGGLKGTVRVSRDADLTQPTGEAWAAESGRL
jgi:hypothetical protein